MSGKVSAVGSIDLWTIKGSAPHVQEDLLGVRAVRRLDDVKLAHLGPGDEPAIVTKDDVGVAPAPPARRRLGEVALEDGPAEEPKVRMDLADAEG